MYIDKRIVKAKKQKRILHNKTQFWIILFDSKDAVDGLKKERKHKRLENV